MKEEASLSIFLKDLAATKRNLGSYPEDAYHRLKFPSDTKEVGAEVCNINEAGRGEERNNQPYFRLSADFKMSEDRKQEILSEALRLGKILNLPKGYYEAYLGTHWEARDFIGEAKIPLSVNSKLRLLARSSSVNPNATRGLGQNIRMHTADIELKQQRLTVESDNEYRQSLKDVARVVKPQFAIVQLSGEDAEKIAELAKEATAGSLSVTLKELQPQEQTSFRLSLGGLSIESGKIIQVNLPVAQLALIEEKLQKDLFRPAKNQISHIRSFFKTYSVLDVMLGRGIADLKEASRVLKDIALNPIGNYAISLEQAKALLNKEVQSLQEFYGNKTAYLLAGVGQTRLYGAIVDRLAGELFDRDILSLDEGLSVEEYISVLASRGYDPVRSEIDSEWKTAMVKQKHLLEFYEQVYRCNPELAVKLYREAYLNTAPSVLVFADVKEDGSRAKKLEMASKAKINSFGIKQPLGPDISGPKDELLLGISNVYATQFSFWSKCKIDGSGPLLSLQEWAHHKMGVSFTVE